MLTNTAATIYNQYKNYETKQTEWHKTVLDAVCWEDSKAANVISSGLATADAVSIVIWFSVKTDGKTYLPPKQYAGLSPGDVTNYWTMTPGIDRIIKGISNETIPPADIQDIVNKYDACITVKSVDTADYGSKRMQHWEVSGS